MRTLEVPVWLAVVVTLGVAFVGAGGAIGAQLVAAWRQRKRENVKWQRDRETEMAKIHQHHVGQWRELKVKTYGPVLAKLRYAESLLNSMKNLDGTHFEQVYQEYFDNIALLANDVSEVELICSSTLSDFLHADENKRKITLLSMPPNLASFAKAGDAHDAQLRRHKELVQIGREFRRGFLAAAREEIGVDAPGILDPA